jgi:hypothetical protein
MQRSWCFVSSWWSSDVRSHDPGSAGPTGRSLPPGHARTTGALDGLPRHARDDPALASGARPPAPRLPAPTAGTTSHIGGDGRADRPSGAGEPPLRLPAHRRGAEEARRHRVQGQHRQRSSALSASTSATGGRTDLDRVPARPGQGHRRHRLPHHRHRLPPPLLGALRDRCRETRRAPPRRHPQTPTAWVTQVARNFCADIEDADDQRVLFFIRDRDTKFTASFDNVFASIEAGTIFTPVRSPKANAFPVTVGAHRPRGLPRPRTRALQMPPRVDAPSVSRQLLSRPATDRRRPACETKKATQPWIESDQG